MCLTMRGKNKLQNDMKERVMDTFYEYNYNLL